MFVVPLGSLHARPEEVQEPWPAGVPARCRRRTLSRSLLLFGIAACRRSLGTGIVFLRAAARTSCRSCPVGRSKRARLVGRSGVRDRHPVQRCLPCRRSGSHRSSPRPGRRSRSSSREGSPPAPIANTRPAAITSVSGSKQRPPPYCTGYRRARVPVLSCPLLHCVRAEVSPPITERRLVTRLRAPRPTRFPQTPYERPSGRLAAIHPMIRSGDHPRAAVAGTSHLRYNTSGK